MLVRCPDRNAVEVVATTRLRMRHLFGVVCEYRDGILHLRGRARSFYHKQLAQELVRRVDGVAAVLNQIVVDSVAK